MPRGGVQTSLAGMVQTLTAAFRGRQSGAPGKGAPVYSYASSQNGGAQDITQFAPVFQPSGGLFAPGYPLVPVDYERTRRYNFPVGINYIYTPRSFEPIGFAELKALANDDITRLCIETRKDQIEKLGWTIKPRDEEATQKAGTDKRMNQLTEFWQYPDGITPFGSWLRQLVDQVLVTDAPALEPRLNRGGDIIGLDIIDGATIKVLIDDTGRRPRPPAPAFEQIIHGRPWVLLEDGTRANTEEGDVVGQFTDQQLIYFPRNPRPDHLYGFSPVEQIVLTINTSIRRGIMQLQHFTVGNIPAGMVNAPNGWTGEQIARFQDWFDSKLSGNTGERTKLLWGPEGAKYQQIKEPPIKDDFDEWRARVICFAFSLPPTAFTRQVNRATAETAQEAALEEGLAPLMIWVKRLIDNVIQRRMGHPDLEFAWSDVKPIDPTDQADMLVNLVGAGLNTLNEARDQLGLDPVEGGDEILFKTGTGPVTLDSILNPPEPPPMPAPGGAPGGPGGPGGPGQNGQNPGAKNDPGEPGKPPNSRTQRGKTPSPRAGGKKQPAKGKPGQQPEKPEGGAQPSGAGGKSPKQSPAKAGTKKIAGVGKVATDPLRQAAGEPPQHSLAGPHQDPVAAEARELLQRARTRGGAATGEGDAAGGLGEAVDLPPPWRLISGIVSKAGDTISQDEADYTEDGPVEAERCLHCTMFRAPDSCTLVEGDIHPEGHCRFFEAITGKASGHVDSENARPVGLPLADDILEADIQHIAWQIIRDAMARGELPKTETRTVPIADLVATQRVVDDERVEDDEADFRQHGQGHEEPFVVERDDKFYILAGHHHTEGALEAGATEMRVQVLLP